MLPPKRARKVAAKASRSTEAFSHRRTRNLPRGDKKLGGARFERIEMLPEPMSAEYEETRRKRIELIEDAVQSRKLVGQRVRLQGLTSRPELNGTTGSILGFHEEKERYAVALQSGEKIRLKPSNVQPTAHFEIMKTARRMKASNTLTLVGNGVGA